jgi:hypothetical protein
LTYPGLDITAEIFPFLRRVGGAGVGGMGADSKDTFCRLLRLEDGAIVGSDAGTGLASRTGAFRFRDEGRVDSSGDGIEAADVPGEGSEDPACLADDARVTLEDMSISLTEMNLWYCQLFSGDGESLEGVDEFEYGRGWMRT